MNRLHFGKGRQTLRSEKIDYRQEGRGRPTARHVIDLFDDIHRHRLNDGSQAPTVFVTELSDLQRRILKLLGVPPTEYRG